MSIESKRYLEIELVRLVCSPKQIQSYEKQGKFAGGKQRAMFLKRLSECCEFEYDSEKREYCVLKVLAVPQTKAEKQLHDGIYQFLAPLILNRVIEYERQNQTAVLTSFELAREIGLVNQNYNLIRYNIKTAKKDLNIPYKELNDFLSIVYRRIDDYVCRCIKYLQSDGAIGANEVHIIQTFEETAKIESHTIVVTKESDRHIASADEMTLYQQLVTMASDIAGTHTNREQRFGKDSYKFKNSIRQLLYDNGIDYVSRGLELWCTDIKKAEQLIAEYDNFSTISYTEQLNLKFKALIDRNAEKLAAKKELPDANYVEHFKTLSSLTLLNGAEDVRKRFSTWKMGSEWMGKKASKMPVEYRVNVR